MRRLILLLGALGLVATACGDDDASTTTSANTTAAASSTTAAATTTTATSTTAVPSTTAAPSTTADPAAARVAFALIYAGEWEGTWDNTTFGSSGPPTMAVTVDADARTAALTIDLGGSVFGAGDPGPFEVVVDLTAALPYSVATPLLGEVTFAINNVGHFTMDAPDVPAAGIASLEIRGIADPAGIDLGYTVAFEGGGEAEGIASLRRPAG
jgi:hypothetical protein